MSDGTGRLRAGIGAIVAIAAVLILMPLPAAGNFSGHTGLVPAVKTGALGELGRAIQVRSHGGVEALGGGYLGTWSVPSDVGKVSAVVPRAASAGLSTALVNPTSPQVLSSFAGVNQASGGGFAKPDTQVAVNGSYVFELVSAYGKVTSTTGATVYKHFKLTTFFNTTHTDTVDQAQVVFDLMSQRWFVSALDSTTNLVYWAVSTTSSPTGTFLFYSTSIFFSGLGPQFMDAPFLGVSKSYFAWSVHLFNSSTLGFLGSGMVIMNKAKLESGSYVAGLFGATGMEGLVPAREITNNHTSADVLYVASTGTPGSSTTLTVYEISGPVHGLSITAVTYTIMNTGTVPSGAQAGTTVAISTGDDRVQSVSWSNAGILWVSFGTGCVPSGDLSVRSCVRVVGIYTPVNSLSQDADTAVAGMYLYYGALTAVTTGGGYLMVLGGSNAVTYPSVYVSGQNITDAFGSFRGPVPVVAGTSYSAIGRYGDYSGIQFQLSGTKIAAWGATEFSTPSGWGTRLVHFAFY